MSARDQLERVLFVLAQAAREDGARVADLARALDVDAATIMADIQEATERAFYQPAGTVEQFSLFLDGDVVRMFSSVDFQRPVRLSQAEAMALGLGLRVLAAEAEVERRASILALATRLEHELAVPALDLQPAITARSVKEEALEAAPFVQMVFGEDDVRGLAADAIERGVYCAMTYLRSGAREPAVRRVAPLRLLFGNGQWYMLALDVDAPAEPRRFRLDRVLALTLTNEQHEHKASELDAEATFSGNDAQPVTVRYSRNVARWVAEREDAHCDADGTLALTHDVADMNWLVRHVLQYGGEAVVETPTARQAVREAARQV